MDKNNKSPLPGHTRVKKKMIPDFIHRGNWRFSRYLDDVLPEIVGIALINDAHGYRKGAELCLALARGMKAIGEIGNIFVSNFESLDDSARKALLEFLDNSGHLAAISVAFTPINRILGPCPLAVFEDHRHLSDEECLKHLTDCVDAHTDRYGSRTSCSLATLYYSQACIDRIKIAEGLHVPDLEAIIRDPESDEGQRAAADVRIYSMMEIGFHSERSETNWPSVFWGRCKRASPCQPYDFEDDSEDECNKGVC